jgi:ABC-type nitrate/sulfonate/bicarbonate transport system substrate-binding protein
MRLTAAMGVVLAIVAAGCGDDDDKGAGGEPTLEVGLAFSPGLDDTADRVAFDHLEQETGIKAEFTETGGPPNTAVGLMRGDFDLGSTSLLSAVNAIDQGADLKVVLGAAMAVDFFLVAGEGITDIEQLEGKNVSHGEPGGASEVVTKVALDRAGVDAELSVVDDSEARMAALVAGRVDAAALEFPDYELLSSREEGLTPVASLKDIAPFLIADVWMVSEDFAEENPELVREVVAGLLDGYEEVRTESGRAAWFEQARPYTGEDGAETVLDEVYARHDAVGYWPERDRPVDPARHDRLVRFWRENDLVEGEPAFDEVWDVSFWRSAGG